MFDPTAGRPRPAQPGPLARACPFCGGAIPAPAVGCPWCGRVLAQPAPRNPPVRSVRHYAAAIGLVIGGLLIALSPALGWIHVIVLGDLTLFDLVKLSSASTGQFVLLPIALVACGVAGIALGIGLRYGPAARATAAVLGLVAAIVGILLSISLLRAAAETNGLVGLAAGIWLELAGAVIMLAGAVIPAPDAGRAVPSSSNWRRIAPITTVFLVTTMLAIGLAAVTPTGEVSAGGPALPPAPAQTPTTSAPNTIAPTALSAAEALVQDKGYTPASDTNWTRVTGLNVVLGTLTGSADGYAELAFFFYDGHYLGNDTSATSASIRESWSDDQTIALTYTLYNPNDPMCCATAGAAIVRYQATGNGLRALDPIPPADSTTAASRR